MTSKNLINILSKANKKNYAVAGLVVLGWEDALAYTKAADETGIPIILQAGPGCRRHTPIPILGKMFQYLAQQTKTSIVSHIDHAYSYKECMEGMDNGFTSVMFDGSKLSLGENIKITKSIAKKAKIYNISVEGEIGFVGYDNGKKSKGTDIKDVKIFSHESGVDAIAISVGNTHLKTKKDSEIDIKKIIEIQKITNIPLVLHGGSGISQSDKRKIAKSTNVAKFNIGTELRQKFGSIVRKNIMINKKIFDRNDILGPTINEIKNLTKKIIINIGPK